MTLCVVHNFLPDSPSSVKKIHESTIERCREFGPRQSITKDTCVRLDAGACSCMKLYMAWHLYKTITMLQIRSHFKQQLNSFKHPGGLGAN